MRAIILAGGNSSRMGRDKALVVVKGRSLLQRQLDVFIAAKIPTLVLSNDNKLLKLPPYYNELSLVEVVPDVKESIEGPLSGLLSGLRAMAVRGGQQGGGIIVLSCDVFGMPASVFDALNKKRLAEGADVACLSIAGRIQPLIAVLSASLEESLAAYFEQGGRSVMRWYSQFDVVCLTEVDLQLMGVHQNDYASNLNSEDDVQSLLYNISNK
ncbi:MAG: molybdenum cofactor guanylyltransferase [Sinobacterium sp.]|nr:molybdenum cofactor guanylyltransferase [Sinobacterium sp.]